jgi:hypothetical protein
MVGHSMCEFDLHGFRVMEIADTCVIRNIIQQCWEMGETEVRIIHGHARNRGISPSFVNTNTSSLGVAIRSELRKSPELRQFIKISTLKCGDAGWTSIDLKRNPTRTALDPNLVPEPQFFQR